jgi:hypothetical protein
LFFFFDSIAGILQGNKRPGGNTGFSRRIIAGKVPKGKNRSPIIGSIYEDFGCRPG